MSASAQGSQGRHPYADLPESRYWKTAVAQVDPLAIRLDWEPKFAIDRGTRIATAGSCFAQHIGRALVAGGFRWVDSEPAPADLAPERRAEHGYGIFSFRTGNIYTASLLRQWVRWSLRVDVPDDEVFVEDGRCHDPFRPAFPTEGYGTPEELAAARGRTLDCMRETLAETDLLIFTLGLTETWMNGRGTVYPMCPGTLRGRFQPDLHRFRNADEPEVVRDLAETFDLLRAHNSRLRFLLTVSPVPLVATASGQHVLVATQYSKSVLRAAAGRLAALREDVDYFPSYELVAGAPFRARFFDPNLRTVSQEGVGFVMRQFLEAVDGRGPGGATAPAAPPAARAAESPVEGESSPPSEICDEIVLETWARTRALVAESGQEGFPLLLIGDSQIGMVARALDAMGVPYAGGAIMNGSGWDAIELVCTGDERLFRFNKPEPQATWEEACRRLADAFAGGQGADRWVITNIGTHTPTILVNNALDKFLRGVYRGFLPENVPVGDLRHFVWTYRSPHTRFVRALVDAGYKVVWITDPPTQDRHIQPLCAALDAILAEYFAATGCHVFNARAWIEELGGLPDAFRSSEIDAVTGRPDWMHGSPDYYRSLVAEIFRRHDICGFQRRPSVTLPDAGAVTSGVKQ